MTSELSLIHPREPRAEPVRIDKRLVAISSPFSANKKTENVFWMISGLVVIES